MVRWQSRMAVEVFMRSTKIDFETMYKVIKEPFLLGPLHSSEAMLIEDLILHWEIPK